jgi:hypothetical protein
MQVKILRAAPNKANRMNNRVKHLPKHWQDWVANHPDLSQGKCTSEFNNVVSLKWEDGSHAIFDYAFFVQDDEHKEIAVFTEHCGYHVFPLGGFEVKNYKLMQRDSLNEN